MPETMPAARLSERSIETAMPVSISARAVQIDGRPGNDVNSRVTCSLNSTDSRANDRSNRYSAKRAAAAATTTTDAAGAMTRAARLPENSRRTQIASTNWLTAVIGTWGE